MVKIAGIKNKISLITIYFSLFVWLWTVFNISNWKRNNVIIHDIISYYSYLPATFIYNDLTFQFTDNLPKDFSGTIWYLKAPNGARVQKMSMGLSAMYSPFFFAAHQIAKLTNYLADGYSAPYGMGLVFSSLFYAFLAILLLRKILLQFFSDKITALTLLILVFGTNLFFYVTNESPMSHAYSFFLFSAFMYYTLKWHKTQSISNAFALGLIGGLIILIRPSNIVIFSIPVLYGIYSKETFNHKIKLIARNWQQILLILFLVCIVFFPQMLYWKKITGEWLYYSYGKEKFFFAHPNILKGLFSFRKGWLIYTPLMALSIVGIPFLFTRLKQFALPITIFFIVNLYIVFSWWCWWYGGSFGMRSLIETYAVLAIPLAVCLKYLFEKKIWIKLGSAVLIFLLISLNLYQTLQYRRGVIHWDSMTKEAYWSIFCSLKIPEKYPEFIKTPDYENALLGKEEYIK